MATTTTDAAGTRRRARRPRRARARGRSRPVARVADLGRGVAEARRDRDRAARVAVRGVVGLEARVRAPRPDRRASHCSGRTSTLRRGHRSSRSQRAVRRLRHRRGDRHRARRAHRAESHPALGGRLDGHEPDDDAVDRVVPRRHRAVRHDRGVDPLRRSSSARRRRSRTGSSPASTTPHRCSCARHACWARRAGSRSATWCSPRRCPTYVAGLKQGWAFAWRSLLAGELLVLIAGKSSLGRELDTARQFADYPGLYATMIVILIIGIVADAVFGFAERRIRRRYGLVDAASRVSRDRRPTAPRLQGVRFAPISPAWRHPATARETAGTTICLIVRYVRHHAGDEGVARLLALAGDDRPLAVLENEQHWSTYEEKIALLEAAAVVLDDPDVALHIGETALDHSVGPGIRILLRRLGSPRMVLANVVEGGGEVLDRDRHVRRAPRQGLRGHPLPPPRPGARAPRRLPAEHRLHAHDRSSCSACRRSRVEHPECQVLGAPECEYVVHWTTGRRRQRRRDAVLAEPGRRAGGAARAPAVDHRRPRVLRRHRRGARPHRHQRRPIGERARLPARAVRHRRGHRPGARRRHRRRRPRRASPPRCSTARSASGPAASSSRSRRAGRSTAGSPRSTTTTRSSPSRRGCSPPTRRARPPHSTPPPRSTRPAGAARRPRRCSGSPGRCPSPRAPPHRPHRGRRDDRDPRRPRDRGDALGRRPAPRCGSPAGRGGRSRRRRLHRRVRAPGRRRSANLAALLETDGARIVHLDGDVDEPDRRRARAARRSRPSRSHRSAPTTASSSGSRSRR